MEPRKYRFDVFLRFDNDSRVPIVRGIEAEDSIRAVIAAVIEHYNVTTVDDIFGTINELSIDAKECGKDHVLFRTRAGGPMDVSDAWRSIIRDFLNDNTHITGVHTEPITDEELFAMIDA